MKRNIFNQHIADASWQPLFITEMGWNAPQGQRRLPTITVEGADYDFTVVAQRSGFQILSCQTESIPTMALCRKIDLKLRRQANDYIAIYAVGGTEHHLWACPLKMNEKRDMVIVEYMNAAQAEFLFSKMQSLTFDLDEQTTIIDVRQRVQQAFAVNSEKITKNFYAGFRKQHKEFATFITGIDDNIPLYDNKRQELNRNKLWYASVMLNRLMFCYFIQKKGFLNGDVDYLAHRLEQVQQEEGRGAFYRSFYRTFLVSLFHDGLNAPRHTPEWEHKFGRIPYLNGGMFDVHQLEEQYDGIDIADEAFTSLFAFFDTWQWHLDTRITASGNDINPDVLGYIFEQYINDRAAMGAYYTKEDITEYISKNCILPWLFDRVAESSSRDSFRPDGAVWTQLRESGDRYIYDAVKRGYSADWTSRLPENIAQGLDTNQPHLLERRKDWNLPTPEPFALPTEIWRETIERLKRCDAVRHKIEGGEITHINDFITLNLDIRSFAYDVLSTTDDHRLVANFYRALQSVTILDPTCGSGAFLFAALNILEPLYEVCILRMQEFAGKNPNLFKDELGEIASKYRSNIQYFIYKSIILRNLYGVDIMVEATEIAKLRLFLKLVAVVEVDLRADNMGLDPLPDVDFNIRCGNTLVGYATEKELEHDLAYGDMYENLEFKNTIEQQLKVVSSAYEIFRDVQLKGKDDRAEYAEAKKQLRDTLAQLNDLLSRKMHGGRGDYDYYLKTHQPFHWLAEFYQIMKGKGGFDVVIGNPPYVTFKDDSLPYKVKNYNCYQSKNLFALVGERCTVIANEMAGIGYIIPLSGMSINGFVSFQKIIYRDRISWNSYYSGDRNPAELFTGVKIRAGVYLSRPIIGTKCTKYVCRYLKYYTQERENLFSKIHYVESYSSDSAPKLDGELGKSVIIKVSKAGRSLSYEFKSEDEVFYHAAPIHWGKALYDLSILKENDLNIADSYKRINVSKSYKEIIFDILNSSLFFYFWIVTSDCYNLTHNYFAIFKIPEIENKKELCVLAKRLNVDLMSKINIVEYTYKNRGKVRFAQFFPKKSKPIIDEIDKVLAAHYGFTDEELDFIINYDIKYRMGDELNGKDND